MKINKGCTKIPLGLIWHIRRSLSWIDSADTVGLESIELQSRMPAAAADSPEWHRRALLEGLSVNGLYCPEQNGSRATIVLFVRDLYRGMPKLYWLSPALTMRVVRTLSHEIGHHIIARKGYIFSRGENLQSSEYEEEMASRYSFSIAKKMKARCYYRLGFWAIKNLAAWHSGQAMIDWKAGNYERAAESWYKSFHLDPDLHEAVHWYKLAKEKANQRLS